jgi:NSS family neurotransmitter:Na+ symporter
MEYGNLYALIFFTLLAVAAWTSAISLLEPATAYLIERTSCNRLISVLIVGGATWLLGIGSVLSFNHWSEFLLWGKNFQELIEYASTNVMLPVGGLLIAIFTGWVLSRVIVREQLADINDEMYRSWLWLMRLFVPLALLIVLLNAAGVF